MSVLRGLTVVLLALPVLTATPAPAAPTRGAPAAVLAPEPHRLSLADAIGRLPNAVEARKGYVRTAFKYWFAHALHRRPLLRSRPGRNR